ncbi:unnamed protein product, partial [Prunus brigantina]
QKKRLSILRNTPTISLTVSLVCPWRVEDGQHNRKVHDTSFSVSDTYRRSIRYEHTPHDRRIGAT